MIESEVLHLALQGFQCGAKETKEERHCVNRLQFPRNGVGAGRKSRAVQPLQEWEVSDESDSEALNCSQPIYCTQRQAARTARRVLGCRVAYVRADVRARRGGYAGPTLYARRRRPGVAVGTRSRAWPSQTFPLSPAPWPIVQTQ